MKYLPLFLSTVLMVSTGTIRAEAIFVDTSGSMGYGLMTTAGARFPERRIDVVSRFLSYTFSNWGFESSPLVFTWSEIAIAVPGSTTELATYFDSNRQRPAGSTKLGKVMTDEHNWAICEPVVVVTDKSPSDWRKFEAMLQTYLTNTPVAIAIIDNLDSRVTYEYFAKLSDLPHYRVVVLKEGSGDGTLLELIREQHELVPVPGTSCGRNT